MKKIVFFIHRFNDIDHLSPYIYFLSKSNIEIKIVSLFPHQNHKNDFRIKYLLSSRKVRFYNFTNLHNKSIIYRVLDFFLTRGPLSGSLSNDLNLLFKKNKTSKNNIIKILLHIITTSLIYFLIKLNLYNFLIKFFYSSKWAKVFYLTLEPSLIVTDHAISSGPQQYLYPIKSILNIAKKRNIKILSLPHGVPLFLKHPHRYNSVKENLSKDISDHLVLQHGLWLDECLKFGLNKNKVKIFGLPRFYESWENILYNIVPPDNSISSLDRNKIKVVFMDTGPNNYGNEINKVSATINYLSSNEYISFIYKPHTRNNKLNTPYSKNILYAKDVHSINLIKWADIIIGSSSSIMIEALFQKKLYLSPSYFRKNKMIFEHYNACLEIKTLESLKAFMKDINKKSLNPADYYNDKDVKRFYRDIIYNGKNEDIILQEVFDYIVSISK